MGEAAGSATAGDLHMTSGLVGVEKHKRVGPVRNCVFIRYRAALAGRARRGLTERANDFDTSSAIDTKVDR